jgi:hypothetical protein
MLSALNQTYQSKQKLKGYLIKDGYLKRMIKKDEEKLS